MRVYNRQHQYYCGSDLHVKTMYVCILDTDGPGARAPECPVDAEGLPGDRGALSG